MKIITSAQNPQFKQLLKLATKQSYRNQAGLAILEGSHLVGEWLRVFGAPNLCVVRERKELNTEVRELIQECEALGVEILSLDSRLYDKISPVKNSAGIISIVKIPQPGKINPLIDTIILENIQDPGNLGTIFRSAVASGVEQIICSEGTVAAWSPKVLRAAMGAHFQLKIFEGQDLESVIKNLNVPIYATSLETTQSIYDKDLTEVKAWIFGNEGAGVSPAIQNLATEKVIIPQAGMVESLNVAMAAAICLFEQMRQRIAD